MLISYKENKKGINQSNADLSPLVASIELHSNQMWKDLRELHKLAKLFKMLKSMILTIIKWVINEEQCTSTMIEIID